MDIKEIRVYWTCSRTQGSSENRPATKRGIIYQMLSIKVMLWDTLRNVPNTLILEIAHFKIGDWHKLTAWGCRGYGRIPNTEKLAIIWAKNFKIWAKYTATFTCKWGITYKYKFQCWDLDVVCPPPYHNSWLRACIKPNASVLNPHLQRVYGILLNSIPADVWFYSTYLFAWYAI